jgi:flagellar motor protein MotB
MADEGLRPIIVKRIKKGGHGHHGGAWKIAYADFVTAMMAFFLLMWLLGSTTKGDWKASPNSSRPRSRWRCGRLRQRRLVVDHAGRRQGPDAP